MDKIEKKSDGTTVTIDSLRRVFTTPAWEELKDDNSRVTKLIKSPVFKNADG